MESAASTSLPQNANAFSASSTANPIAKNDESRASRSAAGGAPAGTSFAKPPLSAGGLAGLKGLLVVFLYLGRAPILTEQLPRPGRYASRSPRR